MRKQLLIAALAVVACGGAAETGDTAAGTTNTTEVTTTTTVAAGTTGSEPTTTTEAPPVPGIHVAATGLGPILVDSDGFALYVFTNDEDGESTCYDSCEQAWPPVPTDTPLSPDLDPARFGSTTRRDGSEQLTLNGMPLYRYAADVEPGDTNGQGINGIWFVVDPQGNPVDGSGQDVADPGGDAGYDY